ncbi:MAG: hypothetical protein ABSD98_15630 [Candidatus Korobacteraceae bacterium]|jgi:hypothetical protein
MELMSFLLFLIRRLRASEFGLVFNAPDSQELLARYFEVAREIDELKLSQRPGKILELATFQEHWDDPLVVSPLSEGEG